MAHVAYVTLPLDITILLGNPLWSQKYIISNILIGLFW